MTLHILVESILTFNDLRIETYILVPGVHCGLDLPLARQADVDPFLGHGLEGHVALLSALMEEELTVLVSFTLSNKRVTDEIK